MSKWPEIIGIIHKFKDLKDDWDYNGSPRIPDHVVDGAIKLAELLQQANYAEPCAVVPCPTNEITFDWRNENSHCSVDIISSSMAECMTKVGDECWDHIDFYISEEGIQKFINKNGH